MSRRYLLAAALILALCAVAHAQQQRPLILVANDDGIGSEGLLPLAEEMAKLGEVIVIAPKSNRSGVGHGITYRDPVAYGSSDAFGSLEAWWVDALPASCVRWALATRTGGRLPDLVVSGINDGSNMGVAIYYSGTVGAAREGALAGCSAIAFSMNRGAEVDYRGAAERGREIASAVLALGERRVLLNVNFPAGKIGPETVSEITTLTAMRWRDEYHDRANPRGGRYFWITYSPDREPEAGSDAAAVIAGRISITPILIMATDAKAAEELSGALR